jgi:hypothetical protein
MADTVLVAGFFMRGMIQYQVGGGGKFQPKTGNEMRLIGLTLIALAALACNLRGQTVVVNDNLSIFDPIHSSDTYEFGIFLEQDAAKSTYTEVFLDYDFTRVSFNNTLLDESMDVYLVKPGDIFSPANIQAGLFPKVFVVYPYATSSVVVGTRDFYLGISTGIGTAQVPGEYVPNRTAFGWVHLHPIFPAAVARVSMVDNVMSYDSPGIIVGTTTLVPEPATISTTICALLCFAGRRWRRN